MLLNYQKDLEGQVQKARRRTVSVPGQGGFVWAYQSREIYLGECVFRIWLELIVKKLLGKPLFPVKANPATSCACLVHSGSRKEENKAKVTVCADISKEDISLIFKNTQVKDSTLEEKLKEGCGGELIVDCDEISPCMLAFYPSYYLVVELPAKLRGFPLVEKVDVPPKKTKLTLQITMPLFGIETRGVTLIDCPGTHENNLLSAKAVTYTQMASIIIYVFRISTGISIQVDSFSNQFTRRRTQMLSILRCKGN